MTIWSVLKVHFSKDNNGGRWVGVPERCNSMAVSELGCKNTNISNSVTEPTSNCSTVPMTTTNNAVRLSTTSTAVTCL